MRPLHWCVKCTREIWARTPPTRMRKHRGKTRRFVFFRLAASVFIHQRCSQSAFPILCASTDRRYFALLDFMHQQISRRFLIVIIIIIHKPDIKRMEVSVRVGDWLAAIDVLPFFCSLVHQIHVDRLSVKRERQKQRPSTTKIETIKR